MNVIITGATKGIGRAIAIAFAKEGYNLGICSRTAADLDVFQTELLKINPKIDIFTKAVDVSKKSAVLAFGEFIKSKWKTVDILINNAGTFLPGEMMKEADGNLEMMIETNLYSAYYLTRSIVPMMQTAKNGHVFNMCSIASFMAYSNGGSYSISKFAMLGMSKVLREEMKPHGVRVTTVMPGATWSNSWAGFDGPEDRLMKPEDIAETILSVSKLSKQSVVEEIIIRPQLGDL
jgi:short-subunit dehydrogenase